MATINILFAGVGGQGIVTASDILAEAALAAGWGVKKAETHGMAQRGGGVTSHVRLDPEGEVHSPLIPEGQADYLVALELLEGLRSLWMLRAEGVVLADRRKIAPSGAPRDDVQYPADAESVLSARGVVVSATDEATKLGDARAANAVLLGLLATKLAIPEEAWQTAFARHLKPKAAEINWKAFVLGQGA
jgi:indolepyruvate ferredoxin oxidoreductase beta subunit